MALPTFTMRQLLEAGVHFGHHTRRWNPKMAPFIFGERNNIHILNLDETVPMLSRALEAIRATLAGGGRVLFVGTKRQAGEQIKEAARRCGHMTLLMKQCLVMNGTSNSIVVILVVVVVVVAVVSTNRTPAERNLVNVWQ